MLNLILMILLNFVVGGCIGLTGIAGFLLPMFYTGFLDMPSSASLALSFAAFLISGILGSVNYYKSGNLDLKTAGVLSAGSFVGALAGAPGRTWHQCLYRKQKCNENQPDAAETDRGCGFDCDRVHQTLSLIENGASHSRYFSLQIKSQY